MQGDEGGARLEGVESQPGPEQQQQQSQMLDLGLAAGQPLAGHVVEGGARGSSGSASTGALPTAVAAARDYASSLTDFAARNSNYSASPLSELLASSPHDTSFTYGMRAVASQSQQAQQQQQHEEALAALSGSAPALLQSLNQPDTFDDVSLAMDALASMDPSMVASMHLPGPGSAQHSGPDVNQAVTGSAAEDNSSRVVCSFYKRTGTCAYGERCKFLHPSDCPPPRLNQRGYPLRPEEPDCPHYIKKGWCAFGSTCKFHHQEADAASASIAQLQLMTPGAAHAQGPAGYPLGNLPGQLPGGPQLHAQGAYLGLPQHGLQGQAAAMQLHPGQGPAMPAHLYPFQHATAARHGPTAASAMYYVPQDHGALGGGAGGMHMSLPGSSLQGGGGGGSGGGGGGLPMMALGGGAPGSAAAAAYMMQQPAADLGDYQAASGSYHTGSAGFEQSLVAAGGGGRAPSPYGYQMGLGAAPGSGSAAYPAHMLHGAAAGLPGGYMPGGGGGRSRGGGEAMMAPGGGGYGGGGGGFDARRQQGQFLPPGAGGGGGAQQRPNQQLHQLHQQQQQAQYGEGLGQLQGSPMMMPMPMAMPVSLARTSASSRAGPPSFQQDAGGGYEGPGGPGLGAGGAQAPVSSQLASAMQRLRLREGGAK